jgi:glycosyltransferase involved in cell wall biosynthesis
VTGSPSDTEQALPAESRQAGGELSGGGGLVELQRPIRVCFVALQAYNVLSGDRGSSHIGGAEVQQCVIARELVRRGYCVSFATLDHGQPDGEDLAGIRVFKSYAPDAGLYGLRFFHPRMTSLWAAMSRADADVYFQRTSDSVTGVVAAFCQWRKRRFIFSIGATADCDPALPNCRARRERWLYLYGLRRANLIVAQTRVQQEQLRKHFGRESILVRSAAPDPGKTQPAWSTGGWRPRFLWVGRNCREKRPELLLDLARRCPEAEFDAVGLAESQVAHLFPRSAPAELPNLRLHGYVPYHEVSAFYDRAWGLICTSTVEGFPNTFLEAWSRGLPVLTTCDPDGIIASEGVGWVADDVTGLAEQICRAARKSAEWRHCSARAHNYHLAHHTPAVVLDCYESILESLLTPE